MSKSNLLVGYFDNSEDEKQKMTLNVDHSKDIEIMTYYITNKMKIYMIC